LIERARVVFCPDLTDPDAPQIPVGTIEVHGRCVALTWTPSAALRATLDPLTRELFDAAPVYLGDLLKAGDLDAAARALRHSSLTIVRDPPPRLP